MNSIKSTDTAIPYDYYSLMVCRPEGVTGKVKAEAENLGYVPCIYTSWDLGVDSLISVFSCVFPLSCDGCLYTFSEILWGDSIKPSRYNLKMLEDVTCQKVCSTKPKADNVVC